MEELKTIDSESCKEIYIILNKLGLFYKLPDELKEYISKNQSLSYEYDFDIDLPLIYQIDNEKTKAYISYLYLKYINDSNDEKNILLRKYEQNEAKKQEELRQKYNPNDLFKKQEEPETPAPMVVYKESIFKKILNRIKKIFKKGN